MINFQCQKESNNQINYQYYNSNTTLSTKATLSNIPEDDDNIISEKQINKLLENDQLSDLVQLAISKKIVKQYGKIKFKRTSFKKGNSIVFRKQASKAILLAKIINIVEIHLEQFEKKLILLQVNRYLTKKEVKVEERLRRCLGEDEVFLNIFDDEYYIEPQQIVRMGNVHNLDEYVYSHKIKKNVDFFQRAQYNIHKDIFVPPIEQ